MLLDVIVACASLVVVAPAVVALLNSHVSYTPRARLQKRLLNSVGAGREVAGRDRRERSGRARHRVIHADYRGHAARGYDWLLRHLLGPFFDWRLRYLNDRERQRVARAQKSGDVYKAASAGPA